MRLRHPRPAALAALSTAAVLAVLLALLAGPTQPAGAAAVVHVEEVPACALAARLSAITAAGGDVLGFAPAVAYQTEKERLCVPAACTTCPWCDGGSGKAGAAAAGDAGPKAVGDCFTAPGWHAWSYTVVWK